MYPGFKVKRHCLFSHISGMPKSKSISDYLYQIVEELMMKLNDQGVAAQITFFDNKPWIRLSAQVYNCKEDYVKLREKLTDIFNF